jgi:hypothetical protein
LLAKFMMRVTTGVSDLELIKRDVSPHLEWVLGLECEMGQPQLQELVMEANRLKGQLRNLKAISALELKQVYEAMSTIQGYDYGGSASSHWYECPNGHAYFIGECGGAMQESRCNECGAPVGGTSHHLLASNRPATNFLSRLFGTQQP